MFITTGKRPCKHGIDGFVEPLPDGSGIRPVTNPDTHDQSSLEYSRAKWARLPCRGWWPLHPAEPIEGVRVSSKFSLADGTPKKYTLDWVVIM